MMDYKKFQGKCIEDVARHRTDLSRYCMNYYEDFDGNLILADSDGDNCTEYCVVTFDGKSKYFHKTFAESYTSDGDIMNVSPEFMR